MSTGPRELVREGRLPAARGRRQSGIPAAAGRRRAARRRASALLRGRCRPLARTAAGGCSATAPRRRPARAMRWKTASRCRARCPTSIARSRSSGWRRSSRRSRPSSSALSRRDDSRVCVLTPGPLNETYFEHAYLARYLGFLLVEGEDLTVRDDGVFIRTVSGLKRADVLVRRLDADFADPLELNARSRLGVPGLVQAVRDGTVVIANALGSGVVEARALLSFLPALAPAVLERDLALPNVATWWLGQAARARGGRRPARRHGDRVRLPGRTARPPRATGGARREPRGRGAQPNPRGDRPPRHRLRRPGGGDAVDHAGLARGQARAAAVHPAAVPGARQRRLAGDARRLRARRRRRSTRAR